MGKRVKVARRISKALAYEPLESRFALSGSPSALSHAEALTLSFAPDGTKVQGWPSSLNSTLAVDSGISLWQQSIARAFQTWAQYADVNIGVVPDGGQPLGIQGPTHDDPRFGDIRIAGIPLSPDTTGEAIGERQTIAGSWSGDVVLNTDAVWSDAAKVFQVALHEAGHSFGLAHSTDPASPMFTHAGALTGGPTGDDIAQLQALYGVRRPDAFEGSNGNDSISRAARIPHAELADGFNGTTPLAVYGDINNATDNDVFLLPVLTGYHGPLTFQLWTSGISLLQARISLLDENGVVLATNQSLSQLGDVLTVQLSAVTAAKYYVKIEANTNDAFGTGAYGLVVKYDQLITTTDQDVKQAVLQGHQWEAATDDSDDEVDIRKLLTDGTTPQLADDHHLDDSTDGAKALTPVFDTPLVRRFQFVGTVSDAADTDVYRMRSQSSPSADRGLSIAVENLDDAALVPQIHVLDKVGVELPTSLVSNGLGLVMLRVSNILDNQDYFVRISSSLGIGNYAVTASFDEAPITRTLLTAGEINPATPARLENLYVARPQLFSFALDSQASAGSPAGQSIWATIYDDKHRTVAFIGEAAGEFRSTDSVLLSPGTYHIRFEGRDATGSAAASVSYRLFADVISDPLGPPLVDTATSGMGDFVCAGDGSNSAYCYPGNVTSDSPFASGTTDQPPLEDPLPDINPPPDNWFSPLDYSPTNPVDPLDVNNDQNVAPDDVLDVINYINANGSGPDELAPAFSGYLDTDNDGHVAANDVLIIINDLNSADPAPGTANSALLMDQSEPSPLAPLWEGEARPPILATDRSFAPAIPAQLELGKPPIRSTYWAQQTQLIEPSLLDLLTFDLARRTSNARRLG